MPLGWPAGEGEPQRRLPSPNGMALAAAFLAVRVLGRNDARHDGGRRATRGGFLDPVGVSVAVALSHGA